MGSAPRKLTTDPKRDIDKRKFEFKMGSLTMPVDKGFGLPPAPKIHPHHRHNSSRQKRAA